MWTLWQGGRPFEELRHLNIDAITYWFLRGLTVDGLPARCARPSTPRPARSR